MYSLFIHYYIKLRKAANAHIGLAGTCESLTFFLDK